MIKKITIIFLFTICVVGAYSQKLQLNDQEFELKNVVGSITLNSMVKKFCNLKEI